MASVSKGTPPTVPAVPVKLSFAKVVASGIPSGKEKANAQASTANFANTSEHPKVYGAIPRTQSGSSNYTGHRNVGSSSSERAEPLKSLAPTDSMGQLNGLLNGVALDDSNCSETSAKHPSDEGKSVASGTTFALDEKESLRPDDSASVKAAAEEEDVSSPPGSSVVDLRNGSDGGPKAFRDQLREIERSGPLPRRGPPIQRYHMSMPAPPPQEGLISTQLPIADEYRAPLQPLNGHTLFQPVELPPKPDEKLLEAIESPRDRVFVIKIQQDITDFVKDPKEHSLILPQCNSFYRLLIHKLADYFLLGHRLDDTGQAVEIYKTPSCTIPPPLVDLSNPPTVASTPPPIGLARKIMRRGEESRDSGLYTLSRDPSRRASENGGDSNSEDGKANDPKSLTREQREAKYNEARARIFQGFEEKALDASEKSAEKPGSNAESNEPSRASSTAEKRRNKNNRNNQADDFDTRSSFAPAYPRLYQGDTAFIPMAATPATMHRGMYQGHESLDAYPTGRSGFVGFPPNQSYYAMGYTPPNVQESSHFSWPHEQFASSQHHGSSFGPCGSPTYGGLHYASMKEYESSMQQHTPSNTVSASPANYQQSLWNLGTQESFGWPQEPYQTHLQGFHDNQMSMPYREVSMQPVPQEQPFFHGSPSNQVPRTPGRFGLQGSSGTPRFNPQTQAFVPGVPSGQPSTISQPSPPSRTSAPSLYNPGHSAQQLPNSNRQNFNKSSQSRQHGSLKQASQSNSSSRSTISKWGTPASLPPKPPPPAVQQTEIHALPPHIPPANVAPYASRN